MFIVFPLSIDGFNTLVCKTIVLTVVVIEMPHEETRKIIKVGETSLAVILPKSWLRYYKLTNKDEVLVVSNGVVTIKPQPEKIQECQKTQ